jgi:hypothetical protein
VRLGAGYPNRLEYAIIVLAMMEQPFIHHRPRRLDHTFARRFEFEMDILDGPGKDGIGARCPDCDCVMMYRGVARLRNGSLVHYFECVHSHHEVHSVSITITE